MMLSMQNMICMQNMIFMQHIIFMQNMICINLLLIFKHFFDPLNNAFVQIQAERQIQLQIQKGSPQLTVHLRVDCV